jgi:membrane protease YdiL (CAAX protease family)
LKEIRKILLFLIGSAVLGALLTPWLYWGAKWAAARTQWSFLVDADFAQIFDRGVLVAAVLLLWPTFRSLKIRGADQLGLVPDPHRGRHLTIGLVSGLVCMAAYGGLLLWLGVFRMKVDPPWTALLKIAVSAITVAFLEEWLFRGVILGLFRRALVDWAAVVCTATVFSIIHFLRPPSGDPGPIDWLSGLRVLPSCFEKFSEPALLGAGFTTLFLLGTMLGWATLHTRALWLPIGLHAGLVFSKFGFNKLTKRSNLETMPWVGEDMIVGLGALAVVACAWLAAWLWCHYADSRNRAARW